MSEELPPEFLALLESVVAKRPRTVIDHILAHGQITTEELRDVYGYNHPPRAIRDVREHGIPIVTFRVLGSDGRRIAAYRFGNPSQVRATRLSGRTAFATGIKDALIRDYGSRCHISLEEFPARELQIDHRIPFEVAGEGIGIRSADDYMLLSASANRAKSWSCKNCENWVSKDPVVCQSCYWAFPENYTHVAMREIRRLDLIWSGDESAEYDAIHDEAEQSQVTIPAYVKEVLRRHLNR
jgi:hypothetical protein